MSEEIFAVVDENDEVIDFRPRSEVHRLGLRHRAVHILVFNGRGEVLLQKRSMTKECCPGLWDSSAAGHVDCGESYDDCAHRELKEELGLGEEIALERLFKIAASVETGWEFCWVYRCRADGPFEYCRTEIDALAWYEPLALDRELIEQPAKFSGTVPIIWARLRAGSTVPRQS